VCYEVAHCPRKTVRNTGLVVRFWLLIEQRDRHQPEVRLGKELQLNLIEMRKADKLNLSSGALNAWITFFEHWQEELTMADIAYQPVKDALQRVKCQVQQD